MSLNELDYVYNELYHHVSGLLINLIYVLRKFHVELLAS